MEKKRTMGLGTPLFVFLQYDSEQIIDIISCI